MFRSIEKGHYRVKDLAPVRRKNKIKLDDIKLNVNTICSTVKNIVKRDIPYQFQENLSYKKEAKVFGREVGDDRADFSKCPYKLALGQTVQEFVFEMKTSKEDTFISMRIFNFCEVTSILPNSQHFGSFDYARKSGTFKWLNFLDVPVLRLIGDYQKRTSSHSSTVGGKVSLLGCRIKTVNQSQKFIMNLAYCIQAACLNVTRSKEPAALPRIAGGIGAQSLWDNCYNLFISVMEYRGGGYDRVYGTAIEELKDILKVYDSGSLSEYKIPKLCEKLRDKHEYLHGTYDEKVFIMNKELNSKVFNKELTPVYRFNPMNLPLQGVEAR